MRVFKGSDRLLRGQPRQRKIKWGWVLLLTALAILNGYLIFIRGLPGITPTPASAPAPGPDAAPAPAPAPAFASAGGEMAGVSGLRASKEIAAEPGAHLSGSRFDLAEARQLAGLRTIEQWCESTQGSIGRRETFSTALVRVGLGSAEVAALTQALKGVFDFRRCLPGDAFEILRSPKGTLERFVYQKSPLLSYRVDRRERGLAGQAIEQQADVAVEPIGIRIQDSLYASLERAGESPALVMMIVDIFAWDIDFYMDTQQGDTIRLLCEKLTVGGKFVRYGRILAAEYRGQVGTHPAYLFTTGDQTEGYYDAEGGSLRRAFLKSPLKFTRISSGYGTRVHPILGFSRMHAGIDLSAPSGTPIWAPGDGTVQFAGYKGDAGKLIVLRHANGYETVFAHLQSIAAGIRVGTRVKQKQQIGAVGSTGLSTGPHLHYAMKRSGKLVNPFSQKFPPANPVPKDELPRYLELIRPLMERLLAIDVPAGIQTAALDGSGKETG